jgi:tRNA(fMet)-specific endonuclease VapC
MGLIIDTNVFIDAEHQRFDLACLQSFSHYGDAYISVVTMSELLTGIHLAKSIDMKLKRTAFVENILSRIPTLPFNDEIARTYAELCGFVLHSKNKLKRNAHDLQIAATAINYGYALLTSNLQDFQAIPGLIVESPF